MQYQLSFFLPFVVIILLGRPVQSFISLILLLSALYSVFFVNIEQGVALYFSSVIHAILLVAIDRKNKRTLKLNKVLEKISHG